MDRHVDGYVTASEYLPTWQAEMSPAWLDHVAAYAGVAAPRARRGAPFRYCEVGCGLGWTLNLLAAANPEGRFVGIDAMDSQVRHARAVARAASLRNVQFLHLTLEQAATRRFARCDYMAAHGLYTWISDENAGRLFALAGRLLKPGGLLYLGYNVEPGWSALRPVQRLLFEHARHGTAPSQQNPVREGLQLVHALREAGARGLPSGGRAASMLEYVERHDSRYLTHEFLNACWRPVFVTEAHGRAAGQGLSYVGSARLSQRRTDLVLGRAARAIIEAQPEGLLRELVRDTCLGQSFRNDVFALGPRRLTRARAWSRRLAGHFALTVPRGRIEYAVHTPGGRLKFDNPAARAVTRALEAGPCRVRDVHARGGRVRCTDGDLLAVLDALLCARLVAPVDPRKRAPRAAAMSALLRRAIALRDPAWRGLRAQVGRHGTCVATGPLDLVLAEVAPTGTARLAAVRRHLDAMGVAIAEVVPVAEDQEPVAALREAMRGWSGRRRILRNMGVL